MRPSHMCKNPVHGPVTYHFVTLVGNMKMASTSLWFC